MNLNRRGGTRNTGSDPSKYRKIALKRKKEKEPVKETDWNKKIYHISVRDMIKP